MLRIFKPLPYLERTPDFIDSFLRAIRQTFVFSGRATRAEFWYFCFFVSLPGALAIAAERDFVINNNTDLWFAFYLENMLFFFLGLIPLFTLTIRRLRDAKLPVFLIFLFLLSPVGGIILLALMLVPTRASVMRTVSLAD
jgi:hypothetical protein